ncbi:MAG TPA: DegT/DnrJ/EryC1/StrS family aminotransferase [Conexibacter sp.]|nr:DegT/DnrJ/EryC1/StrS family aminotransferase [Conexibacter sp.]
MTDGRPRYPFARPELPPPAAWLGHLERSYEQRWFSNGGPLVRQLERALELRDPTAGRRAVTVASATAGLVAALIALDLRGPVALPSFTFPASAHAVELAGCTPVLCDVDADTWELSPAAAARALREHDCVAIMHVRAFGLCRDLSAIETVAREGGVPLVVDSAAAYGGESADGLPPGRAGDAEVFSLHATKVLAAGEGGAVLAAPALADAIRAVSNFALAGTEVTGRGLNAKMSELTAAVGLAALEQLDGHVAQRRDAVAQMVAAIGDLPVELAQAAGSPPWQGLPLLLPDAASRERLLTALHATGIEARRYYFPGLHRTRAFAGHAAGPLPVTDEIASRIACIPVYSAYQRGELEQLTRTLARTLTSTMEESGGLSRC